MEQDNEELPSLRAQLTRSIRVSTRVLIRLLYSTPAYACKEMPLKVVSMGPVIRNKKAYTLILDLDQTLVHTTLEDDNTYLRPSSIPHATLRLCVPDETGRPKNYVFNVWYRPALEMFLQWASESFEIAIFSAGVPEYVHAVLKHIPGSEYISRAPVFTRDHIHVFSPGGVPHFYEEIVKDISVIMTDEDHPHMHANARQAKYVIVVDDKIEDHFKQLDNVVPIAPFFGDPNDEELQWLQTTLQELKTAPDVRDELRRRFNLRGYVYQRLQDDFKESIT